MVRPNLVGRSFVNHRHVAATTPLAAATTLPQRYLATTTAASSSNTTTTTTTLEQQRQRQPNNFTQYVTQMKTTCPDAMQQYAACVVQAQERGSSTTLHGACQAEFAAVKECFRTVRQASYDDDAAAASKLL